MYKLFIACFFVVSLISCNPCTDAPADNQNSSIQKIWYNYLIKQSDSEVDARIFTTNQDGSSQRPFATRSGYITDLGYITGPPIGNYILFVNRFGKNGTQIILCTKNGSDAKIITATDSVRDISFPILSPRLDRIGYIGHEITGQFSSLRIMAIDGSYDKIIADDIQRESQAFFSPDGTMIAYYTKNSEIAIINSDGSNKRIIATQASSANDNYSQLSWSPDSKNIAYLKTFYPGKLRSAIAIVEVSTGNSRILYENQLMEVTDPAWSPDGKMIAFCMSFAQNPDRVSTYIMWAVDGSTRREIISPKGKFARFPIWSPKSDHLLFSYLDPAGWNNAPSVQVYDLFGNVTLLGNGILTAYWDNE